MANMLTKEDLQAIGQVVEEKIEAKVPAIVEKQLKDVLEAVNEGFETVERHFETVERRIDGVENRMLTLEKLERYEVGLTERHDKRYVRKLA